MAALAGLKTFTFASPITLTSGTRYAFIFRLNSASSRRQTVAYTCSCTGTSTGSNPYASGQIVTSSNSGGQLGGRSDERRPRFELHHIHQPGFRPDRHVRLVAQGREPGGRQHGNVDDSHLQRHDARRHLGEVQGRGQQFRLRSVQLRGARRHGGDVLHDQRRQPQPVQRLPLSQVRGDPGHLGRLGNAKSGERSGLLRRRRWRRLDDA